MITGLRDSGGSGQSHRHIRNFSNIDRHGNRFSRQRVPFEPIAGRRRAQALLRTLLLLGDLGLGLSRVVDETTVLRVGRSIRRRAPVVQGSAEPVRADDPEDAAAHLVGLDGVHPFHAVPPFLTTGGSLARGAPS